MYIQLGSLLFEKAFTPSTWAHEDESNYAEHALLNQKPLLQPTGNNLETIDLTLPLHVDFCDPEDVLLTLKSNKDNFTVLPLLAGTGQYLGDFIILKLSKTINTSFDDGKIIDASVDVSLKEYIINDKLAQQQNAAKKQAFAVDKKPVRSITTQKATLPQSAVAELSKTISNVNALSGRVSEYQNNVSKQASLADKIQKNLQNADKSLSSFIDKVNNLPTLQTIGNITSAANSVRNVITNFHFPITSVDDLKTNTRDLQGSIRALQFGTTELTNLIITRGG